LAADAPSRQPLPLLSVGGRGEQSGDEEAGKRRGEREGRGGVGKGNVMQQ